MTFERKLREIGSVRGGEDKKSKRLWDEPWHGGWCWEEVLQGKQRRWHSRGRKKCQLLLKQCCSLSILNLFFLLHSLYSSGINNLRKVHFLSMWSCHFCLILWASVDFFPYITLSVSLAAFLSVHVPASQSLHAFQLIISFLRRPQ